MKKNFKTLVLGIVIGALAVSVPVMADVVWERIEVMRNQIAVMVDGERLEADNFVYKETTYVPIRAVAEALGLNVTYENGVAYIEEKYAADFGGEKIAIGSFTATTEELNAYKKLCKVQPGYENADDATITTAATTALIEYKALAALAEENNIVAGEEFYNNFSNTIAYMKMQYGGEEALNAALEQAGYTYEMFKRYHESNYYYEKLLTKVFSATDEQIKAYYDANVANLTYDGVQAKHILIKTQDADGKDITDSKKLKELEEKANSIYKEAKAGADFDELIAKYNEDPGMARYPDGYTFTKGEMVAEFEKAAFDMKDGEISQPVKTSYGYHIIKKIKDVDTTPLTPELSSQIAALVAETNFYNALNAKMATN